MTKVFVLRSVVVSDGVNKWVLEKGKEYDLPDDVARKVIAEGAASEVLVKRTPAPSGVRRAEPPIKPAVWGLLCYLEVNEAGQGRITNKELLEALTNVGFSPSDSKAALKEAMRSDLVYPGSILSPKAKELIYPAKVFGEAISERVGGELHTRLLRSIAYDCHKFRLHTRFDTGEDTHARAPDILVTPLLRDKEGRPNATKWDIEHQFAVEVEVEPKKHPERIMEHFKNNRDASLPTYFLTTGREDNMNKIIDLVREAGGVVDCYYISLVGGDLYTFDRKFYDPNKLAGVGFITWEDKKEQQPEQLAQYHLFKRDGWHLYPRTIAEHEYLYARKYMGGRQPCRSLGPLTPEVAKLLRGKDKGKHQGKHKGKGRGKG
jgi:hypothetical protein